VRLRPIIDPVPTLDVGAAGTTGAIAVARLDRTDRSSQYVSSKKLAVHPNVWQLVSVDEEGNRDLIGLHATTDDSPPQPGDGIIVDDISYEVVETQPARSESPHVGPERVSGLIVVRLVND
jgi:hypothetical protein